MKRRISLFALVALAALGTFAGMTFATGESIGTNTAIATACADASVPATTVPGHSVGVDGSEVHSIPAVTVPGASDHQCQTETNVVTYTVPTVTQTVTIGGGSDFSTCGGNKPDPSIPDCASGAFFIRTHESPEVLPAPFPYCCGIYWETQTNDTYYDASSGSFGRLVSDPLDSSNHVFQSHLENSTAYADFAQENMGTAATHAVSGTETWQSFSVYLPAGFKAAGYRAGQPNAEFNWLHEPMHEDGPSQNKCTGSHDTGAVSLGILDSNAYSTYRFRVQIFAGQQTTSNCAGNVGDYDVDLPVAVTTGHRYQIVEHIKWSGDGTKGSSPGLFEIWVDGVKQASLVTPTLYKHPDGTYETGYSFLGYYRYPGTTAVPTSWSADVYYDDWRLGPSAPSIGFTP